MEGNLTEEEMQRLQSVKSSQEWNEACDAIKGAREGGYPPDWYEKVIMTRLADKVLGAGAGDMRIMAPDEGGTFQEVGRIRPK